MEIDGWRDFKNYDDFKEYMKLEAHLQAESEEQEKDLYYSVLEDLDYFESKKYGKEVSAGGWKHWFPFYGQMLNSLHGGFKIDYWFGKPESIVLSPEVLCEWYERKGF